MSLAVQNMLDQLIATLLDHIQYDIKPLATSIIGVRDFRWRFGIYEMSEEFQFCSAIIGWPGGLEIRKVAVIHSKNEIKFMEVTGLILSRMTKKGN